MQQPYDPVGALGGLFAPAYIHGNQQSSDAVQAWTSAHPYSPAVGAARNNITQAVIDQQNTAPAAAAPAAAAPVYSGYNPYAGTGWWPVFVQNVGQDAAMNWVGQHLGGL